MNESDMSMLAVKGLLTELPQADQDKCRALIKLFQDKVTEAGPIGILALSYVALNAQQAMDKE